MSFQNISDEDGKTLVKMARTVVTEYLTNNIKILNEDFKEKFSFSAGVFVTINDKSGLRGCIGFPLAVKKLSNALTDAAISASTEDPRFPSITQNELNDLVFEVTVLSDTKEISADSPDEIKIQFTVISADDIHVHEMQFKVIDYSFFYKQLLLLNP